MKKNRTLTRIISIVLSVVLSIALCFSLIGLTITSVTRSYFTSDTFKTTIENTDLATLTFYADDEKVTLDQYVKNYVTENIEKAVDDSAVGQFTDFLDPFLEPIIDPVTDYVVDKVLSSEFVNKTVKTEVISMFDYILYSDVEEAKERIKEEITLEENYRLDPNNAPTFEEKVSAEVKIAVFKYIEKESGLTIDQLIVLLSEDTITTFKGLSILFAVLLILVAIPEFPSIFVYLKFVLLGYNLIVNSFISGFQERFAGKEDLISHQLLKPVMDLFVPYSDNAFKLSIVFMVISWVLYIAFFIIKRKKK